MNGYRRPQRQLHREFLYLDIDAITSTLSALGLQRLADSDTGSVPAPRLAAAPHAHAVEPLPTAESVPQPQPSWASPFDTWCSALEAADALGEFDTWGLAVRHELRTGDMIRFDADISLLPLFRLFAAYVAFVDDARKPWSTHHLSGEQLAYAKRVAWLAERWVLGLSHATVPVHVVPGGVPEPQIVASLDRRHLRASAEHLGGRVTVIGRVGEPIAESETLSVATLMRTGGPALRDVHDLATTMAEVLPMADDLGVPVTSDPSLLRAPAVILQPIAIYR